MNIMNDNDSIRSGHTDEDKNTINTINSNSRTNSSSSSSSNSRTNSNSSSGDDKNEMYYNTYDTENKINIDSGADTVIDNNTIKSIFFQGNLPPQRRFVERTESYDPTYAIDIYKYR